MEARAPQSWAELAAQNLPDTEFRLTNEQIHRLACAPLPRIRTVRSVSRWAGMVSVSHTTLEDGRIPRALGLDELDGDKS